MTNDVLWQTKLHARLHDPAEKALVLLRDPEGHEGGSSRALHEVLFAVPVPSKIHSDVERADWWAAAADRPQWPKELWAQVRWTRQPVLIHPLTGQSFDLRSLADTDIGDIKERSFAHFSTLVVKQGDAFDWKRTLFAYWRFGPELVEDKHDGKLGLLWPLLPADTRVPDHSIWDHLDLTSAFAGAFAADPKQEAGLLALSLGPVQGFIAAARSTSDLWAGSHLLSRLSWEAMKPVCERLGPDAILFPRLRGVPQVDLWLRDEIELCTGWFKDAEWEQRATDANPLFAAALPNRFIAVVPASEAEDIAAAVTERVRTWLQCLGKQVVERLLAEAGLPIDETGYAFEQMQRQLEWFPEVHWAAVPFSLIRPRNADKQTDLDVAALSDAMAPFFEVERGKPCGFLASPAWQVLQKEIQWTGNTTFFAPNPGVLYPAVYDLAERVLAAAKSTHAFVQLEQTGWRDLLTGENEWLSLSKEELSRTPGLRGDSLWARIRRNKPGLAKEGEHLGALSAVKRLWPTIFADEVGNALGETVPRFVVSTHTMALAHQLEGWLERGAPITEELRKELEGAEPVAVPRRLASFSGHRGFDLAKRLPDLLERAADDVDDTKARRLRRLVSRALTSGERADEVTSIETYYALLMMDGDEMGAWLSGDKDYARYCDCFHPMVRSEFNRRMAGSQPLDQYGKQPRAMSPNRHLAISTALNDFALYAVPEVVEREHAGRVIYAGGDDVLAMLPVADLIPAMQHLRRAYSGYDPSSADLDWRQALSNRRLVIKDGFGLLRGRLLRLMGGKATASCGAVIAHHQAPLATVLRELRDAEQRAKREGGRNAWSLALIKRSGGTVHLTAKWGEPLGALHALCDFLGDPKVSRRAVYNTLEWLEDLPPGDSTLLQTLLAYQLKRQAEGEVARKASELARQLITVAFDPEFAPAGRRARSLAEGFPDRRRVSRAGTPPMTSVFIEPLDVLVLRGNKLFGDPGSYGESLVPPWPSVAAGAIRSAVLAREGDAFAFARGEWSHPELGTPSEPGPFTVTAFHLARRRGDRVEPLFEPPADLVIGRDDDGLVIRRILAKETAPALSSSNPLPLLPVLAQERRTKPATGRWLTAAGWESYLRGEEIKLGDLVPTETLWRSDLRVGIGLSPATRHVEEGKLFSVNAVAFKPDVGFLARIGGVDLTTDDFLRFGGDGRGARMRVVDVDWPQPDFVRIAGQGRTRLVLTTPGLFESGWLPTSTFEANGAYRFDLHGVRARLVAAALPRAQMISGFDIARSRPKPARRAAPAGSVYWLDELDATPETLRRLVESGLWPNGLHNDPRRAEGFNRATFASFSGEEPDRV